MATQQITLTPSRTYKTEEAAIRLVEKEVGSLPINVRWIMCKNEEGRFFPVILFREELMQYGVQFGNIMIVGG